MKKVLLILVVIGVSIGSLLGSHYLREKLGKSEKDSKTSQNSIMFYAIDAQIVLVSPKS